jgi:transcription elongation factor GreB
MFQEEDDLDYDAEFDVDGDDEREEAAGGGEGQARKNYITPEGFKKLKEEYDQLFRGERPKLVEVIAWAASNGDRSENGDYIYGKRRLREIDRRLRHLGRRMANAVVVNAAEQPRDKVLFGAKVTVESEDGKRATYHIVGEDEIDLEKRKISWVSPVAKALINSKVGDSVIVQRPQGEAELTVLKIEY